MLKQKEKTHKALYEFSIYTEKEIPVLIKNALLLTKHIPQDIKNPVLLFLLPRAINGILEHLILEVKQSWKLLDTVLKDLKKEGLDKNDKDYKDLYIVRDKLIGHFIEVSLSEEGDKYVRWYWEKYGSYEKTFDFIQRVANKIKIKIDELRQENLLIIRDGQIKKSSEIKVDDIVKLLSVLKKGSIY